MGFLIFLAVLFIIGLTLFINFIMVLESETNSEIIIKSRKQVKLKVINKKLSKEINPLMFVAASSPATLPLLWANKDKKYKIFVEYNSENFTVKLSKKEFELVKEGKEYLFEIQEREKYYRNGNKFPWIFYPLLDKNARSNLGQKYLELENKIIFIE